MKDDIINDVISEYREDRFDPQAAFNSYSELRQHPRRHGPRWGMWFAICSVAAVAVLLFSHIGNNSSSCVYASSEQRQLILPDNSVITLSPGSSITYREKDFRKGNRLVSFSGTVFCRIARDEGHTFSIETSNAVIRVLGTEFQVRADGAGTTVDVVSGIVGFRNNGTSEAAELKLTKGMHAVLRSGEPAPELLEADVLNPAAWATGVFSYENATLGEVMKDLSFSYNVNLKTDTPDRLLTGDFGMGEIDEIILLIEDALNVHIDKLPKDNL